MPMLLGVLSMVMSACGFSRDSKSSSKEVAAPSVLESVSSDVAYLAGDASTAAELFAEIKAQNSLGLKLLQEGLDAGAENMLLSPQSIGEAFSMLRPASDGELLVSLRKTFGFQEEEGKHLRARNALKHKLVGISDGQTKLEQVNTFFAQKDFRFAMPFLDSLKRHFDAGVQVVDFKPDPESVRKQINAYGEKATHGMVPEVLPEGSVSSGTRGVLVNALYVKAGWLNEFPKGLSAPMKFHAAFEVSEVPGMVNGETSLAVGDGEAATLVRLPYRKERPQDGGTEAGRLEALVVYPRELKVERKAFLDALDVESLVSSAKQQSVKLFLPKVDLQWKNHLSGILSKHGGSEIFGSALARAVEAGEDEIAIGEAFHAARMKWDEEGMEAAALTAIIAVGTSGLATEKPEPREIKVDRPFLVVIRDTETGVHLFQAWIGKP